MVRVRPIFFDVVMTDSDRSMTLALLLGGTASMLLLLLALGCADVPRAAVAPLSPAGGTFRVCFALGDAGGPGAGTHGRLERWSPWTLSGGKRKWRQ
jgi:hypothetical protein